MNGKITIRDVAKHAGVSPAAVSYVLNGINKVSDETKQRILKAVKDLEYEPNLTAVSLSKRKSNVIAVMFPLVNDSLVTMFKDNHYQSEMISGIEYVLRKNGYDLLISGVQSPSECMKWIRKRNVDGLLFLGVFPNRLYEEMKALSKPIVLVDTYDKYERYFNHITMNDEEGGHQATKHLIDLGHSAIGFIAHRMTNSPIDYKRFIGYEKALKAAGIKPCKSHVFEALDSSFENGYRMGKELLSRPHSMSAFFASSDTLALGIMKALQEEGKRIPEDYSIVGFDDLTFSSYATPSLTTVRQDVFNKGSVAATAIIQAIENDTTALQHIRLSTELIHRESTAKKKG
ncbi:LacI family transcriptional regulator [Priestia veravalensis]|uniref:LacI family transcriptional regulator n=1 Tax=Priestia veravalensis TaxID=1414648 RepID=A0A0V8JPX7_9BACI|nr:MULTISPECIES: LacI family DNA-binding transcriptional regulator [Priestia]KSU89099.1 LacI family transcriptional regulator [Priestia veravalensis]SCB95974.1 transcriptional regulator, LacI family [Priestia flexa]